MSRRRVAAAVLGVALASSSLGCSPDPVEVSAERGVEHNHAALNAAVARFTAGGRSPDAFSHYSREVLALRAGMDSTVADIAERQSVALMLDAAVLVPGAAAGAADAIRTVWPLALAPPITAPIPGLPPADAWTPWMPRDDDRDDTYLERLCGGLLARECHDVVPEGRPAVVAAVAVRRATERIRRAMTSCPTCTEPAWAQRVAGWTELDRAATASVGRVRDASHPLRWPVAGPGAADVPDGPLLTIAVDGLATLDGDEVGPAELVATLASARRASRAHALRVHLPPSSASEQVRTLQARAAAAGYGELALIARAATFPWAARAYPLSVGAALPVRDADTVQILIRQLDR